MIRNCTGTLILLPVPAKNHFHQHVAVPPAWDVEVKEVWLGVRMGEMYSLPVEFNREYPDKRISHYQK